MKEFNALLKDIKNKKFLPVYFFQGEESFYMDRLTHLIEQEALTPEEQGFNQHIVYGKDVKLDDVVSLARQFPMGSDRMLIIVKEAQHIDFKEENRALFETYIQNPQPSTILVFNYKYKKLDGRIKLMSDLKKNKWVYTADLLRDYQIPTWIDDQCMALGVQVDMKSKMMLAEYLGTDLSRIYNELQKLTMILGDEGKYITPELIEKNVGISKEFNNFELNKAVSFKEIDKAMKIIHYFSKDPKDHPLVVTTATLYNLFSKILQFHCLTDTSQQAVASELKIHPFFVKEYAAAARNYPLKKVTRAISLLKELDIKSKGIESGPNSSDDQLIRDFLYQVMYY